MDGVSAVLLIVALYFLPWLIALSRHHNNAVAIFFLNLLLGWTLVGWVVALVWSFMAIPETPGTVGPQAQLKVETPKTCAWCMSLNSRAFRHCAQCGKPLPP